MYWTDERVEELKRLWAQGLGASEIAAKLGGVSRNAVIGKVHRMNMPGREKSQIQGEIAATQEVRKVAGSRRGQHVPTIGLAVRRDPSPKAHTPKAAAIADMTERVFGDAEKAKLWLKTPNRALNGLAPSDLLKSAHGIERLEELLLQIDHGIYV